MPEVRTDVIVTAKPKGFAQVTNETTRLSRAGTQAVEKQVRGFEKFEKSIAGVEKAIQGLEKSFTSMGSRLQQVIQKMGRSMEENQRQIARQGAFAQGLIQGAVPGGGGMFLQRGPGMRRQALGLATGRAVRGFAGGMMRTPFAGVGGLAQAATALPGGELVAGPMTAAMQMGGAALQFQQQQVAAAPFLGAFMGPQQRQAARAQQRIREQGLTTAAINQRVQAAGEAATRRALGVTEGGAALGPFAPLAMRQQQAREAIAGGRALPTQDVETIRREAQQAERKRLMEERLRVGQTPMERMGQRFGFARPEILQTLGAVSQVGGGRGEAFAGRGGRLNVQTVLAAQRLGVSPQVAGAFLQAQRRGGLVGAEVGRPGGMAKEMTDAFADAMKMGLDESEAPQFLQVIAEGIMQWRQTGIPMAKDAITAFGQEVGRLGLGGVRGMAVARGVVGAAQQLSTRGPQTAAELMMMQTLGGFQPGQGGAEAFERAQIQLEQLRGGRLEEGGQLQELMQRLITGGGGGAAGRQFARRAFGQMGVRFGAEEFQLLGRRAMGEELSPEQQARLERIQEQRERIGGRAPQDPADLARRAARMVTNFGEGLGRQAKLTNEQIRIGGEMLDSLQSLQMASMDLSSVFNTVLGDAVTTLAKKIENMTSQLDNLTREEGGLMSVVKAIIP